MANNIVADYVARFRFAIENKQLLEFEKRLAAIEKKIKSFAEGSMPKAAKSIDTVTAKMKEATAVDKAATVVKEKLTKQTVNLANAHVALQQRMKASRQAAAADMRLDIQHAKRIAASRGASFDERMKVLGIRDELRARKNRYNASGGDGTGRARAAGAGAFAGGGSLLNGVGGGMFARAIGATGPLAIGALAVGGAVMGANQLGQKLGEVEQLRYRFQDAYGGKQAGMAGFDRYRAFANRYGVNYRESGEAFTGILQAISPTAGLKEAESMAYGLAKFGAAKGMTTDNLKGVAKAVSQMTSKDRLMREEVYGQLADQSPAALQALVQFLTKKTGTEANKEFQQKLSKKQYTSDSLKGFGEFLSMMAEKGGTLQERSNGVSAAMNRVSNAFTDLFARIGDEGGGNVLVEFFNALIRVLGNIGTLFASKNGAGNMLIFFLETLANTVIAVVHVLQLGVNTIMDLVTNAWALLSRIIPGMEDREFNWERSFTAREGMGEFFDRVGNPSAYSAQAGIASTNVNGPVTINVDGSRNPEATAAAVKKALQTETSQAVIAAPKGAR